MVIVFGAEMLVVPPPRAMVPIFLVMSLSEAPRNIWSSAARRLISPGLTTFRPFDPLCEAIDDRGLDEPLILTSDKFVLSGHRRFEAVKLLEFETAPCRIRRDITREGMDKVEYMRLLQSYNPQRVKTAGSLLREAILRDSTTLEDTQAAIRRVASTARPTVEPEYIEVDGRKYTGEISDNKQAFLRAVQEIVTKMRSYWPLSLRQIHYQLLNDPPLTFTPKRSKFGDEHYRYRNDRGSYQALSNLCVDARYLGAIPFYAIDDPTRTFEHRPGFSSVSGFLRQEMENFLLGYNRDKQKSQPKHIEVFVEKNTLLGVVRDVCRDYYVPLTSGRGFAGPSIWRKMSERFDNSGKEEMVLVVISDFDPEGLELADDAIRSLRDLWNVPINYARVAVTEEQIEEHDLAEDFNPAKETSPRYQSFIDRTGDDKTWECEALELDYLQEELTRVIEENMNMEIFEKEQELEESDTEEIHRVRSELARNFGDLG